MKKYVAELIGTMVLVLMGCGAAVFAGAGQPFDSVGTLGVAFALGLSVVPWRMPSVPSLDAILTRPSRLAFSSPEE